MSLMYGKSEYYRERIKLGSMSIKSEDMPFTTFLIGYYLHKTGGNIDILFQFFDLLEQLKQEKLLSELLKMQLIKILEEFPADLKTMINVLSNYKNGKKVNLIQWIESYLSKVHNQKREEPVPLQNALANDGTIQLQNSYTQQLEEQDELKKIQEQRDIQLARKMQDEFDKEKAPMDEQDVPCEICYCGLFQDRVDGPDKCGHLFHTNCLVQSFKTNIQTNNFPIICPKQDCKQEVSEADLRRILDNTLFQKYQDHTLKAYADRNGDSISWCPTANCTYMFFFQKNDNQRFECLECKKEYCLNCRVQWHKDMTCKEYKVSSTTSEEDKQFIEFVKGKKFKQCPKCKFWVEKNEGCDHMTCKCKFQFCYKCGGIYMKCECVQQMRRDQERRRAQLEERRKRKQDRKKKAVEKAEALAAAAARTEEKRQTRSRRKK